MSDSGEIRYVRAPDVVSRKVAGELILVPTLRRAFEERARSAELCVLNETGERMWEWLSKSCSVADLARNLIGEFEVTAELAHADAASFVDALQVLGAVIPVGGEGPNGSR
jgi:hypothetical protein